MFNRVQTSHGPKEEKLDVPFRENKASLLQVAGRDSGFDNVPG